MRPFVKSFKIKRSKKKTLPSWATEKNNKKDSSILNKSQKELNETLKNLGEQRK